MFKTVWSHNGEIENLLNLPYEEKVEVLSDRYDADFIGELSEDELDDVIYNDTGLFDLTEIDFEYKIVPMISKQVRAGCILDKNFKLIPVINLLDYIQDEATITEDEEGQLFFNNGNAGSFPILGFSDDDDKFSEELYELGISEELEKLYGEEESDIEFEDIESYIPADWSILGETLVHTKNLLTESLEEAVSTKNPEGLAQELEEIKKIVDESDYTEITAMPFENYDNDDISLEYNYPEFYNFAFNFFKEMDFNKDKDSDDPIKKDEFKYMQETNPKGLKRMLEDLWATLDKHSWDTIIRTCEKVISNGGKTIQFEKEYKTGYNSPLDDDEILKSREKEESLKEATRGSSGNYVSDKSLVKQVKNLLDKKWKYFLEDEDSDVIDPYYIAEYLVDHNIILPDEDAYGRPGKVKDLYKEIVKALNNSEEFKEWLKSRFSSELKKGGDGDYYIFPINESLKEGLNLKNNDEVYGYIRNKEIDALTDQRIKEWEKMTGLKTDAIERATIRIRAAVDWDKEHRVQENLNEMDSLFDESLNEDKYDDYEYVGNRRQNGKEYQILRKILKDENGDIIKGVWAAVPQNDNFDYDRKDAFDITYHQGVGLEPIGGQTMASFLGKKLMPKRGYATPHPLRRDESSGIAEKIEEDSIEDLPKSEWPWGDPKKPLR